MEATAPPLSLWPRSCAFSLLSTRRWAMRAAKPTPRTTTTMAAAAQIRCSRFTRGCGSVEAATNLLQVGGQWGLEATAPAVAGVVEGELVGVQERTFHGQRVGATVAGVAGDGMTDGGQVDTYLMGPTGLQPALQERGGHRVGIPLEDLVARSGCPSTSGDRHARWLADRAANGSVDDTATLGHLAQHEGEVAPLDVAPLHLSGEVDQGLGGVGDDHQSGRALVETVHDAGPGGVAHARPLREARQQTVHECAFALSGAGMNDEPGRLVHDDDVGVVIDDRDVHIAVGGETVVGRLRHLDLDDLALDQAPR